MNFSFVPMPIFSMKPYAHFFHSITSAAWLTFAAPALIAAEAKVEPIPASSQRPLVVQLDAAATRKQAADVPPAQLPEGYEITKAAAAPLVTHPIMGCLDDKRRLFVGDGVGVNWNKAQLDANPPNRILMLEDTDHDGIFDKSTIFADKMTFPKAPSGWMAACMWRLRPGFGSSRIRTAMGSRISAR